MVRLAPKGAEQETSKQMPYCPYCRNWPSSKRRKDDGLFEMRKHSMYESGKGPACRGSRKTPAECVSELNAVVMATLRDVTDDNQYVKLFASRYLELFGMKGGVQYSSYDRPWSTGTRSVFGEAGWADVPGFIPFTHHEGACDDCKHPWNSHRKRGQISVGAVRADQLSFGSGCQEAECRCRETVESYDAKALAESERIQEEKYGAVSSPQPVVHQPVRQDPPWSRWHDSELRSEYRRSIRQLRGEERAGGLGFHGIDAARDVYKEMLRRGVDVSDLGYCP